MATFYTFEKIASSFPEVTIGPHFEKISFRVKNKIFATYDDTNGLATVKLSPMDQERFALSNPTIYPVDNKWGKQGWTFMEVDRVNEKVLQEVLATAYCQVAPKALGKRALQNKNRKNG